MTLMFQRSAHNFAKNGYFPTDDKTLSRIVSVLVPAKSGAMRILDPCCGEGVALAKCRAHLGNDDTTAYGIEFDPERARQAKRLLTRCIRADFQNCLIGQQSFGLLFLNPPYGDMVADKGETGNSDSIGRLRLEKLFFSRTLHSLQFGGVLVLIVPHYSLDKLFCQQIANHFERVAVFLAPEERFKQAVIFGVRKRTENTQSNAVVLEQLLRVGQGELPSVLPECWQDEPYAVPAMTQPDITFSCTRLDVAQVQEEINQYPCLWPQFAERFGKFTQPPRRPLMRLSNWHLALALAAGQVSGVVTSKDQRTFLVKGDTFKEVVTNTTYEHLHTDEGIETTQVTTELDRFTPVIRAIDMTRHSPSFGNVLIIR